MQIVFMLRDRVAYDIRLQRLIVMRHGMERGRGRKKEKGLICDPESESLQRVSSWFAKRQRRAYHVTPDLRWHGQQLPYSSLHVPTEYLTCVGGILPYKLLETIYVSLYIPTY